MSKTINKSLVNKIAFFVGAVAIVVAGLVYILATDLALGLGSAWMFVAILLSFGSGVCVILSENFKEKAKVMYSLKGVAIGLAALFVGFMFLYLVSGLKGVGTDKDLFYIKGYRGSSARSCLGIVIATAVVGVLSIAGIVVNIVLTAKLRDVE